MLNIYLILTFILIILYIYFSIKNRNKKEDFSLLNGIYSHKYNYDEIYDDFYSYCINDNSIDKFRFSFKNKGSPKHKQNLSLNLGETLL